ncbi:hypothetical protein DFH09DRAFT_504453 [Mycena vulgaris]|nr:hypothetical protein DFH09DRAFT_504453 [Mycena vulgaris]
MSPPWANLAGLAIGGFFYGVYFALYVTSTYLLIRRSNGAHGSPLYRSTVFISGLILFVTVTGNFSLTICRPFLGFIVFLNGTQAASFFNDNSQITTTVQNVFAALSILIADAMIIYRLWIVWSHNKRVIIVPTLSLIGLTIALGITVQTTSKITDISQDKGLTPGLIFTLITNLYSTGLISWKVWKITKSSSPVHGNNLRDFVSIIVESAALYTIWAVFYIITHQINSDLQFVALIPLPAVAGIANALIQTRIGLGKTIQTTRPSQSGQGGTFSSAHLRMTTGRTNNDAEISRGDLLEMKPVGLAI